MTISEHDEQKALLKWWSFACASFGVPEICLFAVPNAAKRSAKLASMMRAEGMRSGIPDLVLAVARGQFHGLFIEMKKARGGKASPNQIMTLSAFHRQGYAVRICHGFEAARGVIEQYMAGELTAETKKP